MVEQFGYTRFLAKTSVPEGWRHLVDRVFDKLEILSTEPNRRIPKVTTVKEKYGLLCIYTDTYDEELQKVIDELEDESGKTCQVCGNEGHTFEKNRWVFTVCDTHKP